MRRPVFQKQDDSSPRPSTSRTKRSTSAAPREEGQHEHAGTAGKSRLATSSSDSPCRGLSRQRERRGPAPASDPRDRPGDGSTVVPGGRWPCSRRDLFRPLDIDAHPIDAGGICTRRQGRIVRDGGQHEMLRSLRAGPLQNGRGSEAIARRAGASHLGLHRQKGRLFHRDIGPASSPPRFFRAVPDAGRILIRGRARQAEGQGC